MRVLEKVVKLYMSNVFTTGFTNAIASPLGHWIISQEIPED